MDMDFSACKTMPEVPIIRFFTWKSPTISYGYNQNPQKRLNFSNCELDGIDVVRRPTGGRELLHGSDLCFSVIYPLESDLDLIDSTVWLRLINEIIIAGFECLNIEAEISSLGRNIERSGPCLSQCNRGEITVKGRKLVASAQRVFKNLILQQSSILFNKPGNSILNYLKLSGDKITEDDYNNGICYLCEEIDHKISMEELTEIFRCEFGRYFKLKYQS